MCGAYLAEELHTQDRVEELYDEEDTGEVGLGRARLKLRVRVRIGVGNRVRIGVRVSGQGSGSGSGLGLGSRFGLGLGLGSGLVARVGVRAGVGVGVGWARGGAMAGRERRSAVSSDCRPLEDLMRRNTRATARGEARTRE